MVLRHVWLLPVAAVGFTLISIFSGYAIGVTNGHLPVLLPFISNGGGKIPEASVFGEFLNLAAFFLMLTVYMRHRQITEYYVHRLNWKKTSWWRISLLFMLIGFVSAIGATVVANFRVTELKLVHGIGAIVTFLTMVIYGWGQVILGYALIPRLTPLLVNHLRLLIMILATACLVLHELAAIFKIFVPKGAGSPPAWNDFEMFKSDSPFFLNFIIASSAEWAMTLLMMLFLLTFVAEMRTGNARAPHWIWQHTDDENGGLSQWMDDHRRVKCIKLSYINEITTAW
ncbi:hypothetical protein Y032_0275g1034 [Ancylostoma ceylanicum]|uniref:CWH43-like N-terminal domain-containing protein n=1 Tax=Ancylostoma ceylanicum TaxID=53326 RepID=A0A016S7N9_9BILA|nr:hypothetical protein Y032_0275g1034 [Ancylostoma ceylanicum]